MTQASLKSVPIVGDSMVDAAYARLRAGGDAGERIAAAARLLLVIFDEFYGLLCEYPYRAKCAFETMDPHASVRISQERLELYSRYVAEHGPRVLAAFPALADDSKIWDALDKFFVAMIADRYEADIAFSYAHSIRRNISHEIWRPVAYSFPPASRLRAFSMAAVHRRLPVQGRIDAELVASALRVPGFSVPFRDLKGDSQRIQKRLERLLYGEPDAPAPVALEVVDAGFFRDRNAFVVGRWVLADGGIVPFVVALKNGADGIYADAMLHRVSDIHD